MRFITSTSASSNLFSRALKACLKICMRGSRMWLVASSNRSRTSVGHYRQQCHWLTPTNLRNSPFDRNWPKWGPFRTSCIGIYVYWYPERVSQGSLIKEIHLLLFRPQIYGRKSLTSPKVAVNLKLPIRKLGYLSETESPVTEMCHVCWQSDLTTPVSERSQRRRCRPVGYFRDVSAGAARPVRPRPPSAPPRTRTSLATTTGINF